MKKNTAKRLTPARLLGAAAFALLIAALIFLYAAFREKPVTGSKAITIEVVNSANVSTTYALRTDAEYLLGAMTEAEGLTFTGTQGPYGLMLTTVNGEIADYDVNGAYWSITVNGEYGSYGVSEQPVLDGDAFALVYTK